MKKMFLFISMLLILTVSLSFTPVRVNAETEEGLAEPSDFVGNLSCGHEPGDTRVIQFHKNLPEFTNRLYDFLKIITPVIIIITGMIDIVKAVTAQKEDEMKKAQKKFVNRLIAGSVVFLVFVIVELVIGFVIEDEVTNAWNCIECFLVDNTKCKPV